MFVCVCALKVAVFDRFSSNFVQLFLSVQYIGLDKFVGQILVLGVARSNLPFQETIFIAFNMVEQILSPFVLS